MQVSYKGVPLFMNGKEYIIPSLSLRQLEQNHDALANTAEPDSDAADTDPIASTVAMFKKYIPIILLAVQRNYPDVTEDDIWNWLDMGNFAEALSIVQSAAGFKAVTAGEAEPAS